MCVDKKSSSGVLNNFKETITEVEFIKGVIAGLSIVAMWIVLDSIWSLIGMTNSWYKLIMFVLTLGFGYIIKLYLDVASCRGRL